MADGREYRFHIDAFSKDTLPMERLSVYLKDLATLLGNADHVHFMQVEEGQSANLAYKVDDLAVPIVESRLAAIKQQSADAPLEGLKAFGDLNAKLSEDRGTGFIRSETDISNVIIFPGLGILPDAAPVYGPILENGAIDGQVVRVGGVDKTVPVHIRSGQTIHYCNADVEMARKLGPHVLREPIRVFGQAKWYRNESEQWVRRIFTITSFTADLEDVTLGDSIALLRSIPGPLQEMSDPLATLDLIRHGPGDTQPE
jgi:hypothetical protein